MKGRTAWASVGALMLAMIGVMLWKWPESSGEWASWAQAIGAVAALLGVLWVAHADERRKREEQLANAAVTAAILLRTMPELIAMVTVTIHSLGKERSDKAVLARMRELRAGLDGAPLPSEEQMLRVVPIGATLVQTLAHSVGLVTQACGVFGIVLSGAEEDDADELRRGARSVQAILQPALTGLQWCAAELEKFNDASVNAAPSAPTKSPS